MGSVSLPEIAPGFHFPYFSKHFPLFPNSVIFFFLVNRKSLFHKRKRLERTSTFTANQTPLPGVQMEGSCGQNLFLAQVSCSWVSPSFLSNYIAIDVSMSCYCCLSLQHCHMHRTARELVMPSTAKRFPKLAEYPSSDKYSPLGLLKKWIKHPQRNWCHGEGSIM